MNEGTVDTDEVRWSRFVERPADHVHISRLAACFDRLVSEEGCRNLRETPRLGGRLSAIVNVRYGLTGIDTQQLPADDIRVVAMASQAELEEIVVRSGAIYWADSLTRVILGEVTTRLDAELGEGLRIFAAENRDLSGPNQPLEPIEGLRDRLVADGIRCFAAWWAATPDAVAARIRLKTAPGDLLQSDPEPAFAEIGPKIVQRAATQ